MNPVAEILWEASAEVERFGVNRLPSLGDECCAVTAIEDAWDRHALEGAKYDDAFNFLAAAEGIEEIAPWNDAQPSRAVVAAAMRDAAHLAEWASPHLLEAKP